MDDHKLSHVMYVVVTLVGLGFIALLYTLDTYLIGTGPKMYNCSIAEISPDFTPAMREECRKLRRNIK